MLDCDGRIFGISNLPGPSCVGVTIRGREWELGQLRKLRVTSPGFGKSIAGPT